MQPKKSSHDPLEQFRGQAQELILKQYPTIEKFCYEEGFQKSTLSRLLTGKRTTFQIDTLKRIAETLGKRLVIRME